MHLHVDLRDAEAMHVQHVQYSHCSNQRVVLRLPIYYLHAATCMLVLASCAHVHVHATKTYIMYLAIGTRSTVCVMHAAARES